MKFFAMLLVFLAPTMPVGAAQAITKDALIVQGVSRTFYLFVPAGLSGKAPLVILLHGSGRNGLSLAEKWTELAQKERVLIAAPDAKETKGWGIPDDGPDFLKTLVEHIGSRHPIDPGALYLFGHSAGAVFALSMSLLQSEFFAATAIHAGALDGNGKRAISFAKRKIPIAIFVGTNDHIFSLETVRATRNALLERGMPVQLTEIQGHDHWYYDLAPRINAAAWEFLRKHQIRQPRYQNYNFAK